MRIWFDGNITEGASVSVMSHSIHYGGAVFEGIRFYQANDGRYIIFRLEDHIDRLLFSAGVMEMKCPYSAHELKSVVLEMVRQSGLKEGYIRPIIFQGEGLGLCADHLPVHTMVVVVPWVQRTKPMALVISELIRLHPGSSNLEAKVAGHYVNSRLAALEAKRKGVDDGLLLDHEGNVAETSVANVFFVKGREIITPPRGNIFPGLTRDTLIDLLHGVSERKISLVEALTCDAAFIAGTACEVLPISCIGDKMYDTTSSTVLCCQQLYMQATRGRIPSRARWLAYVD